MATCSSDVLGDAPSLEVPVGSCQLYDYPSPSRKKFKVGEVGISSGDIEPVLYRVERSRTYLFFPVTLEAKQSTLCWL